MIANCRLPIADLVHDYCHEECNRQLAIGNWQSPYPTLTEVLNLTCQNETSLIKVSELTDFLAARQL